MTTSERPREERHDQLAETKRIVDLVFRLPVDPDRSVEVVEAVGTVYADLGILDEQRRLDRQLASGISTRDVETAIANVHEAASLRPTDDVATEQRMLVLAGLERIRQATLFNENVGQQTNGIAIVQIGITSKQVETVMIDVQDAKALIEQSQPIIADTPPPTSFGPSDTDENKRQQNEEPTELLQDIVDVTPPLSPKASTEDILDRVERSTSSKPSKHTGRRRLLKGLVLGAGILGTGVVKKDDMWGFVRRGIQSEYEQDPDYEESYKLTTEFGPSRNRIQVRYPTIDDGWELRNIWGRSAVITRGERGFGIPVYVAIPWDSSIYPDQRTVLMDNVYVNTYRDSSGVLVARMNFNWKDRMFPQNEYLLTGHLTEPQGSNANQHPEQVEVRFANTDKPLFLSVEATEIIELNNGKPVQRQTVTLTTLEKVRKT